MKIYILTSQPAKATISKPAFHGVFETYALAIKTAKDNDLYTYEKDVKVIESSINSFIKSIL